MNVEKTIAAARKEWERQMEAERKQPALYKNPSAWREGEPGREESKADVFRQDKAGHVVAEFYGDWQEVKANSEYYIEVRNRNPVVLKKIGEWLDYAQERWDELKASLFGDLEGIAEADAAEMFDGTAQLLDAIALLQIEAVDG